MLSQMKFFIFCSLFYFWWSCIFFVKELNLDNKFRFSIGLNFGINIEIDDEIGIEIEIFYLVNKILEFILFHFMEVRYCYDLFY